MAIATCLKHHFLLAMPNQAGGYFGDTITYVCEHNEDGAMGLMINRPMELELSELLDQLGLEQRLEAHVPVLEGGPVNGERGFILHTSDKHFDASLDLGHGLMLTTARQVLEVIGQGRGPKRFLVALGYAGWGGGQLEAELLENAWLTCPASDDVLFEVPFAERVNTAAKSLGIDFRLMGGQAGHA